VVAAVAWGGVAWFFSSLVAQPGWRRPEAALLQRGHAALAQEGARPFEVRTADGLTLRGMHLPARADNESFVVMVHGYGGNLLEYQEQYRPWRELGFDVFLYDQRACGRSDGEFLSAGILESRDLGAVVAHARTLLPAGARAGIYGRSGGGATVLLFAGQGGACDFVIADCAFSSFPDQLLHRLRVDYTFVPRVMQEPLLATTLLLIRLRFGIDLHDATPLRHVAALRAPVLFLTTRGDTYVPSEMTTALHAAAPAPKRLRVFARGGHGEAFLAQPDEFLAEVRGFVREFAPAR
jgi:pimeloyl-ACP methyl ester carboxylesterase